MAKKKKKKTGGRKKAPKGPVLKIKPETFSSLASLTLLIIGGLIIVSFSGQGSLLKQVQAWLSLNFGWAMLLLPFVFISAGLMLTKHNWKVGRPNVLLGGVLLFVSAMGMTQAGKVGSEVQLNLAALLQPMGAMLILFGVGFSGFMIMTETSLDEFLLMLVNAGKVIGQLFHRTPNLATAQIPSGTDLERKDLKIKGRHGLEEQISTEPRKAMEVKQATKPANKPSISDALIANTPGSGDGLIYQLPPLTMLDEVKGGDADRGDIKKNASIIEKTLDSFGIKAHVVEVNLGPAVTQYALEIALGTKLSKITSLQNDLALALAAPTGQIRIEAPIPGKSQVGIEIPNRTPEMVGLKDLMTSSEMIKSKSRTLTALGLDVSGEPVYADIAKMPHVLIAGSTGSGKSVSINALIISILLRATPDEVKFIMVDPKRVELTGYNGIPHLLTPVIVDADKVVAALEWAVNEMDKRYKLFAEVGVRNIVGYNELSGFQALPYLIVIIDELADIMLFAPSKVEDAITRLAQMARATGIHLILATQRPSVDVITGLIKANITCRIAFNVTSAIDSRVIIDGQGAEKLLGKGDMLYVPPDQAKPRRIQGTYVSDKEINRILDHIKAQNLQVEYTEEVTTKFAPRQVIGADGTTEELDEMFAEAVRIVVNNEKASSSLLQRRLSIGYARAARILDQLEAAGVIGPGDGSKPRQVLITDADAYLSGTA